MVRTLLHGGPHVATRRRPARRAPGRSDRRPGGRRRLHEEARFGDGQVLRSRLKAISKCENQRSSGKLPAATICRPQCSTGSDNAGAPCFQTVDCPNGTCAAPEAATAARLDKIRSKADTKVVGACGPVSPLPPIGAACATTTTGNELESVGSSQPVPEVVGGAIGMDPIFRELPPGIIPLLGTLPSLLTQITEFDIDRFNVALLTVAPGAPATARVDFYDRSGAVIQSITFDAS